MVSRFKGGSFGFEGEYPEEITPPENFMLFAAGNEDNGAQIGTDDASPRYFYRIFICEDPEEKAVEVLTASVEGKLGQMPEPVVRRDDLVVYQSGNLEYRLIGIRGLDRSYAFYAERDEKHADIYFSLKEKGYIRYDTIFVSLFALERRMMEQNALILHSCCIEHNGKSILFTAPSGVGKSTQGSLWENHRGACVLNGDRSLLYKSTEDGVWHATGWPVCGSSEICRQFDLPIQAIVWLSQEPLNSIIPMRAAETYSKITSQITINKWNTDAHMKALDLIMELISEVKVLHLGCTISEEAVAVLEAAIDERI